MTEVTPTDYTLYPLTSQCLEKVRRRIQHTEKIFQISKPYITSHNKSRSDLHIFTSEHFHIRTFSHQNTFIRTFHQNIVIRTFSSDHLHIFKHFIRTFLHQPINMPTPHPSFQLHTPTPPHNHATTISVHKHSVFKTLHCLHSMLDYSPVNVRVKFFRSTRQ